MNFELILENLMSHDNVARKLAENEFTNGLKSNLVGTVTFLIQIFSNISNDIVYRSFSGVLLRNILEKHSSSLSSEVLESFKGQFLLMWSTEESFR
jgi:hypothetical protein